MKDLLKRKPSLAELTGICEPRLDCFATHLQAYFVLSMAPNTLATSSSSLDTLSETSLTCQAARPFSVSSNSSGSQHYGSQEGKANPLYPGRLGPRSSSFKDGLPRNSSLIRGTARGKLMQHEDDSQVYVAENLCVALSLSMMASSSIASGKAKRPASNGLRLSSPTSPEALRIRKSGDSPFPSLISQVTPICSPLFSPYYCWCPPTASSTESLSLPPLSSLLSASNSSNVLVSIPSLDLSDGPPLDFPPLLPEPLVRMPLSATGPQQIPTFTPLICDPIVHIPVIDICSSGQGFLMSAGPVISTTITTSQQKIISPLIPESNSDLEKSARETLRLLISSSSQSNPHLMEVLPSVLTDANDRQSIFAAGSWGLYTGSRDVDAISNSIAAIGTVSLSERFVGTSSTKSCISQGNLLDQSEKIGPRLESAPDDDNGSTFKLREETPD